MVKIRNVEESDLHQINEIQNHYIVNSIATFDVEPSSLNKRLEWVKKFQKQGPYQLLVAEFNGSIVGYTCSFRYRDHCAFDRTVETSIYLAHGQTAKGVGSLLYTELFQRLASEPLHLAVVGIALPNEASIALHKKFGFEEVGVFKEYAMKKNEYISSVWMQKRLS